MKEKFIKISELEKLLKNPELKEAFATVIKEATIYNTERHFQSYLMGNRECYWISNYGGKKGK